MGEIQRSAKVFALTGGATKAEDICRALAERGLGQVRVSVGERLSYADERIVTGTAAELVRSLWKETWACLRCRFRKNMAS